MTLRLSWFFWLWWQRGGITPTRIALYSVLHWLFQHWLNDCTDIVYTCRSMGKRAPFNNSSWVQQRIDCPLTLAEQRCGARISEILFVSAYNAATRHETLSCFAVGREFPFESEGVSTPMASIIHSTSFALLGNVLDSVHGTVLCCAVLCCKMKGFE